MKKIIALFLAVTFCFIMSGCGTDFDRLNYKKGALKYVELCDLDAITIDYESDSFNEKKSEIIASDLESFPQKIESGVLEEGDIANIDYAGSVDGVEFNGGTQAGYNLELGSGSFIDGFEDQLIGVSVGETVSINVTFPDGYSDTTDLATGETTIKLANQPAVFVVKVNYISRPYSEVNEEFAKSAGFNNSDEYIESVNTETAKNLIYEQIISNSKVIKYPDAGHGSAIEYYTNYYTQMAQYYGMTFSDFLTSNEITETEFTQTVTMPDIIFYACFEELDLSLEEGAVDKEIEKIATDNNTTTDNVIKNYTENYIEVQLVCEAVLDKLVEITVK